jgi:hypothetical protein
MHTTPAPQTILELLVAQKARRASAPAKARMAARGNSRAATH